MVKSFTTTKNEWPMPRTAEERGEVSWIDRRATGKITWVARASMPKEKALIDMVEQASKQMGIKKVPKVLIYKADMPNAHSLTMTGNIIFSTGLLEALPTEQLKAIIGHELDHHKHRKRDKNIHSVWTLGAAGGAASILGALAANQIPGLNHYEFAADVVGADIGFVTGVSAASGVQAAHSRRAELKADQQGAKVAGTENMKGSLKTLREKETQLLEDYHYDMEVVTEANKMPTTHPTDETRNKRLDKIKASRNSDKSSENTR